MIDLYSSDELKIQEKHLRQQQLKPGMMKKSAHCMAV
jgi:hypothetical protein